VSTSLARSTALAVDTGSHPVEHDTGQAAFEGPYCALAAVTFVDPPLEVLLARRLVVDLGDRDAVDGLVEVAVALLGRA
jgi:hypothetical protein